MKKEVFLAVFVGFILGLIITFGIWTANKSLRQEPPVISPTPPASLTPTPSPQPTSTVPLSLSSPEDESIASSNSITLSGKTSPNSPVAIIWENGQTITLSDNQGEFEADIKLEGGYNRITVTASDNQGNTTTKDLVVTYTTSKI